MPTQKVSAALLDGAAKPYDIAFYAGFDSTFTAEDVTVQTYGKMIVPRSVSFTGEVGYVETGPTGSTLIVDVEKNGTSIYTTPAYFPAGANTLTAGVLKADGTKNFVAGDMITFKITQVGSTTPGQGIHFSVKGEIS